MKRRLFFGSLFAWSAAPLCAVFSHPVAEKQVLPAAAKPALLLRRVFIQRDGKWIGLHPFSALQKGDLCVIVSDPATDACDGKFFRVLEGIKPATDPSTMGRWSCETEDVPDPFKST